MKIGITERGDAGLNFAWRDKLPSVDGAVLITKCLNDDFIEAVLEESKTCPLIVHATCTGWGGTVIEPNVPVYPEQLKRLKKLIDAGFPIERCVLRIDPIFPTKNGLKRVCEVLDYAFSLKLLPQVRVRISVLDEYPHVKERFREHGFDPVYPKGLFAPKHMMEDVVHTLSRYDIQFHTCAEPYLNSSDGLFVHSGCISNIDLRLMGIPEEKMQTNPQNRHGCCCLSCKTELLDCKHPCKNGCLYCYWK